MNSKKIFTYSLVILTGMMVAALAAYYLVTTLGYTKKQVQGATLPPVTSVLVDGTVQTIATTTSTTTFTIITAAGETKTIVSPHDKTHCEATINMVDVQKIAVTDEVAARGEVLADGSVAPCHDVNHYLKVIKAALIVPAASSTPIKEIATTTATTSTTARIAAPNNANNYTGKLTEATFTGTLQKIDTGCFADGECFAEVDGKHVTVLRGWSQEPVGTIQGMVSFADLEKSIGKKVEVYAQDLGQGAYTLYGNQAFYIKLLP
jgi:hypothetical protein